MIVPSVKKLANGLTLFFVENHSSPVVSVALTSRSGSRYESENQSGYAHLLEHILLKGTKNYPSPTLFSKQIDKFGGYKNAFTTRESLSVIFKISSRYKQVAFDLLSDSIFNSIFDQGILDNEKKVITEEIRKSEDDALKTLWNLSFETVFTTHPLSKKILGTEESILNASIEDLKKYKEIFITPERSALIVIGDIFSEEVEGMISQFSSWNTGITNPKSTKSFELSTLEKKYSFIKKENKQTNFMYNFRTFGSKNQKDVVSLDLLECFLSSGGSSLLKEKLRHNLGLVYNVSANNGIYSDAGMFSFLVSTSKPKEAAGEIELIIKNLINELTQEKFEELKTQKLGYFERHLADLDYQLNFLISSFVLFEKNFSPDDYSKEIEKSSYENLISIINKYFNLQLAVMTEVGPTQFLG